MHPLEKETYNLICKYSLLLENDSVIVAVSGGPDSMALLHVLAKLSKDFSLKLTAAYIDHGLRPEETAQEKELVRIQSKKLNIQFVSGSVGVKKHADQNKISVEHAARTLRHNFLKETAKKLGAQKIALAHTADDQAEELLIRLVRGTGRKGLSGMSIHNSMLIRPFLRFPKKRLLDYLARYDIPWLQDSSNMERIFLRNKIRLDLIPYLEKHFNPGISRTLLKTAEVLESEEKLLEEIAENACTISFERGKKPSQNLTIKIAEFSTFPIAIQRRVLESAFHKMRNKPSVRHIEQLLHQIDKGHQNSILHFSSGLRSIKRTGKLLFSYPAGIVHQRGNLIKFASKYYELAVAGPGSYRIEETGVTVTLECIDCLPEGYDSYEEQNIFLDLDKVSFPMLLRSPLAGDRFHPLGAPGSKKVGDYMTDRKIPKEERDKIPILLDTETIIALPGMQIDNRFRITDSTRNVLRIRIGQDQ